MYAPKFPFFFSSFLSFFLFLSCFFVGFVSQWSEAFGEGRGGETGRFVTSKGGGVGLIAIL